MNNSNGLVTGVLMVLIFVGGFTLGYFVAPSGAADQDGQAQSAQATQTAGTETGSSDISEPTTIDASLMSDGQRQMLETLGVDTDSITVTPKMVSCADARVGADRMVAIRAGDTPTVIEGTKLMACYTAG